MSSRINNCPASLRHGLDQVVNHLRWDGHPLLLECLKQLRHICRDVHPAPNASLQLVESVFVWVNVWGQGQPGENFGRCCWRGTGGAACCMGSGIVLFLALYEPRVELHGSLLISICYTADKSGSWFACTTRQVAPK